MKSVGFMLAVETNKDERVFRNCASSSLFLTLHVVRMGSKPLRRKVCFGANNCSIPMGGGAWRIPATANYLGKAGIVTTANLTNSIVL